MSLSSSILESRLRLIKIQLDWINAAAPERWEKGTKIGGKNVGGQFKTKEQIAQKEKEDKERADRVPAALRNLLEPLGNALNNQDLLSGLGHFPSLEALDEAFMSAPARLQNAAGTFMESAHMQEMVTNASTYLAGVSGEISSTFSEVMGKTEDFLIDTTNGVADFIGKKAEQIKNAYESGDEVLAEVEKQTQDLLEV